MRRSSIFSTSYVTVPQFFLFLVNPESRSNNYSLSSDRDVFHYHPLILILISLPFSLKIISLPGFQSVMVSVPYRYP